MNCKQEKTILPSALAPEAIALLKYLVRRQEPLEIDNLLDLDDAVDEWLIESCAARYHLRRVATPALRSIKKRVALGQLDEDYKLVKKMYSNRQEVSPIELVEETLKNDEVRSIFKRFGVEDSLIDELREVTKQSQAVFKVEDDALLLIRPEGKQRVINNTDTLTAPGEKSLLRQVSHTWATRGRGLSTLVVDPNNNQQLPNEVFWGDSFAQALVYAAWHLDRDVRNLQDLRSFPALEGNDGGAGAIAAAVLIVAGVILVLIAECVSDPRVKDILRVIGLVLTIFGTVVAVDSGVPVTACGTVDPATGSRPCSRI